MYKDYKSPEEQQDRSDVVLHVVALVPTLGSDLHKLLAAVFRVLGPVEVGYYFLHLLHCDLVADAIRAHENSPVFGLITIDNAHVGLANHTASFGQLVSKTP